MKVRLELQYFEDCPNHKKMRDNLYEAIIGLEHKIELTEILVDSEETARKVSFRGSPTVLINGEDIEGIPVPESPTLACRFYPEGIPSAKELRNVILNKLKDD